MSAAALCRRLAGAAGACRALGDGSDICPPSFAPFLPVLARRVSRGSDDPRLPRPLQRGPGYRPARPAQIGFEEEALFFPLAVASE
jgi:hypothetical protein